MSEVTEPQTVFLVDDHPLVREMLTGLINQQPDLRVSGEADDAAQALQKIAADPPAVVVMDISLKTTSGLELLKSIRARLPKVLVAVLSMHDEKLYAERCIRAGARAYVMKGETTARIVTAVRDVLAGRIWISEAVSAGLAQKISLQSRSFGESPLEQLSDRELEVFNLLGRGLATRQVAQSLHVSMKTVQAYCARIKQKLGLNTATELLREAVRWHEGQSAD